MQHKKVKQILKAEKYNNANLKSFFKPPACLGNCKLSHKLLFSFFDNDTLNFAHKGLTIALKLSFKAS